MLHCVKYLLKCGKDLVDEDNLNEIAFEFQQIGGTDALAEIMLTCNQTDFTTIVSLY